MQVYQKEKTLSQFFCPFLKSNLNFEHIQKRKMIVIADLYPELRTQKNLVRSSLKSPVSRDPSRSNMINVGKHC